MRHKLLAITIVLLTSPVSLYAAEPMSADAVKTLMTNNTMNGRNIETNRNFTNYFRADGTATKLTSKGDKWRGKWRVTDDGKHCAKWDKKKGEQCGTIINLGDDTYHKMDGSKPRVEFTVTESNARNL